MAVLRTHNEMLMKTKQQKNEQERSVWDSWGHRLFTGGVTEFLARNQPRPQQRRENLDKLFSDCITGRVENI